MKVIIGIICLFAAGDALLLKSPMTFMKERTINVRAPTTLYMNKKKGSKKKKSSSSSNSSLGFAGALQNSLGFRYAGSILPGMQSPQKIVVEDGIMKPDYADDGVPKNTGRGLLPWIIEVKKEHEIEKMRAAGRVAREVLDIGGQAIRAGISTDEIDNIVHAETLKVCLLRCLLGSTPCLLTYFNL